ncbi:MAG: paraquat-inducible protein A [Geminicoccaceae bacterium]
MACHDCGLVHHVRPLRQGGAASCTRCGAVLYRHKPDSIDRALMLTLAALILFVVANSFPFLTFKLEGRATTSTLMTGVIQLYEDGMWPLALLVFGATILVPLAKLLATTYVLLPLRLGRRVWGTARVFRATEVMRPWAMMEVYLLGVIVAYVKLSDLARLELGIALFAFVALILVMIAAEVALDPREVWDRVGRQAATRSLTGRDSASLVSCDACDQVCRRTPGGHAHCPRCGAPLHRRKPHSLARTWALVIAACILYVPANLLPVMTVTSFGQGEPDTILSGVKALIAAGMWPVALLVFFASITVPVLKIVALIFLLISVQRGSRWRPRDRTVLYRVVESVGRWSMVDIFMISILVALVNLGAIATIVPGPGAIAFAAVVILTMIAAMSFDPRLIWDGQESSRDRQQTVHA